MQYNRSFSCLPSSVPVLKLGMSKEEESKTSEVLLGPVLTGSVRKDLIVPTHRDLWSPESHLDSRAQHPQYLLTPSGWMYIGLLFIFTKIKRTFQFRDDNYRKLLKTSTVTSSCRNSWRRHYPLGPPPTPQWKEAIDCKASYSMEIRSIRSAPKIHHGELYKIQLFALDLVPWNWKPSVWAQMLL